MKPINQRQLDRARNAIFAALAGHYVDNAKASMLARRLLALLIGGSDEDQLDDALSTYLTYGHARVNAVFEIRNLWLAHTAESVTAASTRLRRAGMTVAEIEILLAKEDIT